MVTCFSLLALPLGWYYYSGIFFYVSTFKANWSVAHEYALSLGGELASITNQAEMDFVISIL